MSEERGESLVPRYVKEAVATALGHARHVGGCNGEEVQDLAERRAMEVAVGLNPAI